MEITKSKYNKILFRAGVEIKEFLYYSAWDSNGLFKMNTRSNCTRVIATFESARLEGLHEFAFLFNNEIWFIPSDVHEKIAIYNIDEEMIEYVDIPKYKYVCNNRPFMGYHIINNNAWLFPASMGAVLEVNLITKTMSYHYLLNENDEKDINKKRFIYSSFYVMKDKAYLCPWGEKYITIFNLSNLSVKRMNIEVPQYCYKNIIVKENEIILVPEKLGDGIIVYNIEKENQIKKLCLNENNICDIVIEDKNKVFILPNGKRMVIILDLFKWNYEILNGLNIDEDVVWYEVRNILNKKFIIPYTEKGNMVCFENNEFKILECQHYMDEEICQLLFKLKIGEERKNYGHRI